MKRIVFAAAMLCSTQLVSAQDATTATLTSAKIQPTADSKAWDIIVVSKGELIDPKIEIVGKDYEVKQTSADEATGTITYQVIPAFTIAQSLTMKLKSPSLNEAGYPIGFSVTPTSEGSEIVVTPGKIASTYIAPAPVTQEATNKASTGALDEQTIFYGASWIDPQTLAQARAEYMARTGNMTHLGGGIVSTNVGTLSEGVGMSTGGSTPNTCVATNGTAAIGDGIASGAYGTFRSRLYNSPGTTSGGGSIRLRR